MQHNRYWEAKKVTLYGAVVNALLGFIKLIGGIFFHSHALVADGVHSFSDLFTDIMVLFASKYGSQDADDSHPYGHQRIETAATLMLALVLILAGAGIAYDSLDEIIHGSHTIPRWLALPIAALSIFANEGLFHYTKRIGQRIRSDLIIANAWHHRSDAASSVVVLIGLIGSMMGYAYLDALAAVIVGLMVIKMGLSYGWDSVKELVDSAVEPQMTSKIEQIILSVDGVQKIHQLRSRLMGRDIFIDVHVLVPPFISVSEGHFIAQHVHHALMKQLDRIKDVTVHIDPEDDETCCPSLHLQNRITLEHALLHQWQKDFPQIRSWVLHYLDGKLTIDLICDEASHLTPKLYSRIQADIDLQTQITKIRLYDQHREISV